MLSIGIGNRIGLSRKTIATILALVMFGVGHIYLGSFRRGIGILAIGIGLSLVAYPGFLGINSVLGLNITEGLSLSMTTIIVLAMMIVGLGSIGFWIWQIRDARKLAKQQSIEV